MPFCGETAALSVRLKSDDKLFVRGNYVFFRLYLANALVNNWIVNALLGTWEYFVKRFVWIGEGEGYLEKNVSCQAYSAKQLVRKSLLIDK